MRQQLVAYCRIMSQGNKASGLVIRVLHNLLSQPPPPSQVRGPMDPNSRRKTRRINRVNMTKVGQEGCALNHVTIDEHTVKRAVELS